MTSLAVAGGVPMVCCQELPVLRHTDLGGGARCTAHLTLPTLLGPHCCSPTSHTDRLERVPQASVRRGKTYRHVSDGPKGGLLCSHLQGTQEARGLVRRQAQRARSDSLYGGVHRRDMGGRIRRLGTGLCESLGQAAWYPSWGIRVGTTGEWPGCRLWICQSEPKGMLGSELLEISRSWLILKALPLPSQCGLKASEIQYER